MKHLMNRKRYGLRTVVNIIFFESSDADGVTAERRDPDAGPRGARRGAARARASGGRTGAARSQRTAGRRALPGRYTSDTCVTHARLT